MYSKLLAFDLEIATIIPKGEKWRDHRPFGISCAATLASDAKEARLWYGQGRPNGNPWPQMPALQVGTLIYYLQRMANQGYMICSWNGFGFDFSVLAEESGLHRECVRLALGHLDPMWHFFCANRWTVGLNAVAQGMEVGSKTEGMDGAKAPVLWAEERYEEVLSYCAQDARVTLAVVQAIQERGEIAFLTKSSELRTWEVPGGQLLTAREAMALPEPSPPEWISNPWPRGYFTAWMRLKKIR